MNQFSIKRLGFKLAMAAVLVLPELAGAQYNYNPVGDVQAGFRKTGSNKGLYELVVDLGSVTNFLALSAGTTVNITNYTSAQLTNAFTDTGSFGYLQWSAAACYTPSGRSAPAWVTPVGSFGSQTLWLTVPATNVNNQTTAPTGTSAAGQSDTAVEINSIGSGATYLSGIVGITNTSFLVREPETGYASYILTAFIGDSINTALGDFGANGAPLAYSVENTTPSTFNSPQRDDFYEISPTGYADPFNGSTTAAGYFVGYFLLYPNGTMTFTRASGAVAAPVAGFSGSPTSGTTPLPVTFTDASTGSITNWIWNLGDGTSVTNSSNASVNHTYSVGTNTVSLIVQGSGGSSTNTQVNYIVVTNSLPAAPVAGFTGSPTNIFVSQSVVFTNTSTGSITNWIWNFGNGTSVTNSSGANVTNNYAAAGTNTVSLIVKGAGGSSTNTRTGYIAVLSAKAVFGSGSSPTSFGSGKLGFNGTGGPVGVQYRVLTQTNMSQPLANWTPIYTNVFGANGSYGYTNSTLVGSQGYLILVSP